MSQYGNNIKLLREDTEMLMNTVELTIENRTVDWNNRTNIWRRKGREWSLGTGYGMSDRVGEEVQNGDGCWKIRTEEKYSTQIQYKNEVLWDISAVPSYWSRSQTKQQLWSLNCIWRVRRMSADIVFVLCTLGWNTKDKPMSGRNAELTRRDPIFMRNK